MERLLDYCRKQKEKSRSLSPQEIQKLQPLKHLLIDMVADVFKEQFKSRSNYQVLLNIKDFVFEYGEMKDAFINLVSNISYEKRVIKMEEVFTRGDYRNMKEVNKFLVVTSFHTPL